MTDDDNVIKFPFRARGPKAIKLVLDGEEYELFVKEYEVEHVGPTTEVAMVLATDHMDKETRAKLATSLCQTTLPSELEP